MNWTEGYWVERVLPTAVDILVLANLTIFNLLPEIFNISRRPESVSCSHPLMSSSSSIGRETPSLTPCPVILVQDTSRTLRVHPDNLGNSFNPPSVSIYKKYRFNTSRCGREFTPSSTPTPEILERDKSNSLSLLPDLFNISISPWSDNKCLRVSFSFSRLGKALGRGCQPMMTPVLRRCGNSWPNNGTPNHVSPKTFHPITFHPK